MPPRPRARRDQSTDGTPNPILVDAMTPITETEITNVCALIFTGRTFEPVPRCGLVLLECCRLGLFEDTTRSVPVLSPAGVARAHRGELLR